jgi:predicted nucleotidyltransferase
MAILLTCSCARGKATKDSCLDLAVIIKNIKDKEKIRKFFNRLTKTEKSFMTLKKVGAYSHIDLNVTDGMIKPKHRGWTSGPDNFELEIGNVFRYYVLLFDRNKYFEKLRKKWIPYYNEKLRRKRLLEVKIFCMNSLSHVPLYVNRHLYFEAFDRLYNASQEFMQALFIKKRIYPLSYTKWIKEQYVEILKMPKLYDQIRDIIQIKNFESGEMAGKAAKLKKLVKEYLGFSKKEEGML